MNPIKAFQSVPKCCKERMDYVGRTEATSTTCAHVIVSEVYRCDSCHTAQAVPVEWRAKPEEPKPVEVPAVVPRFRTPLGRFNRPKHLDSFGHGLDAV